MKMHFYWWTYEFFKVGPTKKWAAKMHHISFFSSKIHISKKTAARGAKSVKNGFLTLFYVFFDHLFIFLGYFFMYLWGFLKEISNVPLTSFQLAREKPSFLNIFNFLTWSCEKVRRALTLKLYSNAKDTLVVAAVKEHCQISFLFLTWLCQKFMISWFFKIWNWAWLLKKKVVGTWKIS